jgi:ribosomal protein S8
MTIHTDKLTTLFDKLETSINLRKEYAQIKPLKIYENILRALVMEGVIQSYNITNGLLKVFFNNQNEYIIKFKRISKPSKRVYITSKELTNLNSARSMEINQINKIYLISTPVGIISNKVATLNKIGGEILTEITYKHVNIK